MQTPHADQCDCPLCRYEAPHQDKDCQRELTAFLATLSREQRRLYAAVEANRIGAQGRCQSCGGHGAMRTDHRTGSP